MKVTALRNYRAQLEEALRVELAGIERTLQAAVDDLRQLEAAADSDASQYLADAQTGLTADEVVGRYAELDALAVAVQKAHTMVEEARKLRDQKIGEVLEASREKKKLEILDQRDAVRARRDLDRREQQAIDEVASRRLIAGSGPHTLQKHR